MNLLVTGSGGFLGKHVVNLLSNELKDSDTLLTPRSKKLDLTSFNSTMAYFDQERPDVVLHMAANCGGILYNKTYAADIVKDNLTITVNLFEAIKRYDVEEAYVVGSVCSYPANCPIPFKEDDLWQGFPEQSNSGYGMSKKMLLLLQQEFRRQYGLKGAHFLLVNLFGPHDNFSLTDSHVIPALINKFDSAIKLNKPYVECWGDGSAYREFIFVEDAAEALVKAVMNRLDYEEPINLGTGSDINIKDLAYLISSLMDYKGEIVFTGEVSNGQMKRRLDVSRLREVLGWKAKTDFVVGLKKTIDWYRDWQGMI